MKINLIHVKSKNLSCPDVEINFQKNNKTNFIQMPNGTGKTTLINLIKNTLSNSWGNINEFKNKKTNAAEGLFVLKLEVDDDTRDDITFRIKFDFISGKEHIFTTTNQTSEKTGFHPPKNIRSFLTQDHIKTFLFSGDALDDYFMDSEQTAKKTIDTFSGITKLYQLTKELEIQFRAMMRGKIQGGTESLRKREDLLERREVQIKDGLDSCQGKLDSIMPEWSRLKNIIDSRDDVTEDMNLKIDNKLEEIDDINKKIYSNEAVLAEMSKNLYSISTAWSSQSKSFLDNLAAAKLPGTSRSFFNDIAKQEKCICGDEMTKEKSSIIIDNAKDYLGDDDAGIVNTIKTTNEEALSSSSHDEYLNEIENLKTIKKVKDTLVQDYNDLIFDRDQNSSIQQEIEKFRNLNIKKAELEKAIKDLRKNDDETLAIIKNKDPINISSDFGIKNALTLVRDKIAAKEGYEEYLKKLNKFKEILEVSSVNARNQIFKEITNSVNEKISSSHQDKSFRIESINDSLKIENQGGGSGGQEVTAVTCFALSVLERSGIAFPMVIDHPVTPLQNAARPAISEMLKDLCEQSICFIIDSEKPGFVTKISEPNNFHDYLNDNVGIYTIYRTDDDVQQPLNTPSEENISYKGSNGIVTEDKEFFTNFSLSQEN
jgi:energy-coupling factor transporter ATP-binding protein EcfA2